MSHPAWKCRYRIDRGGWIGEATCKGHEPIHVRAGKYSRAVGRMKAAIIERRVAAQQIVEMES